MAGWQFIPRKALQVELWALFWKSENDKTKKQNETNEEGEEEKNGKKTGTKTWGHQGIVHKRRKTMGKAEETTSLTPRPGQVFAPSPPVRFFLYFAHSLSLLLLPSASFSFFFFFRLHVYFLFLLSSSFFLFLPLVSFCCL